MNTVTDQPIDVTNNIKRGRGRPRKYIDNEESKKAKNTYDKDYYNSRKAEYQRRARQRYYIIKYSESNTSS